MNKKFILLLSLLIVLASCREAEDIMDNTNELMKSARQPSQADESDSTQVNSLEGEDPPVKHGGHWRTTN
ncbi:hypothetical protein AAH994_14740 [Weeksellaceae bacterium A-14]